MVNKRERVDSAAVAMVKASNPEDEVFVITFNEEAFIAQEFTHDVKQLENSLRKVVSKGDTAMRDALVLGLDHLRARSKVDKKVLLVITDGEDNSSVEKQEHLIRAAHLTNAIIYGIGHSRRRGAGECPAREGRPGSFDTRHRRAVLVPGQCGGNRENHARDRA